MSEFVAFMVGETEEVGEGASLLIGSLISQNLKSLENLSLEAAKQGQPLPQEFYDKKDELKSLEELFPVPEEEERSVIITP